MDFDFVVGSDEDLEWKNNIKRLDPKNKLECLSLVIPGNTKGGHCTIDLLFDWFGLVCFANKNKNFQVSYS